MMDLKTYKIKIGNCISSELYVLILLAVFLVSNLSTIDGERLFLENNTENVENSEGALESEDESHSLQEFTNSINPSIITFFVQTKQDYSILTNSEIYFSEITPPPELSISQTI